MGCDEGLDQATPVDEGAYVAPAYPGEPSGHARTQGISSAKSGHALVLAGAGTGTGKTFTIIERARSLIGDGVDPGRIALLTFTRRDLPVRPHEWTIIDRGDQLQVMRRIKVQLIPKGQARLFPSPAEVLGYVSYARSTLVSVEAYLDKFTELGRE